MPPEQFVAALVLFTGAAAFAAGPEGGLAERLEAIVRVHAEIPSRCANRRVSRHRAHRLGRGHRRCRSRRDDRLPDHRGNGSRGDDGGGPGEPGGCRRLRHRLGARPVARNRTAGGQADADRDGDSARRENSGSRRGLRRARGRDAGGRGITPSLRRLLGVPARGCDLHDPAPPCLERCRFARPRRQACWDRLTGGQRRRARPSGQHVCAHRPPAAGDGRPAGARPPIGARVRGSASTCGSWKVRSSLAASRPTVRATRRGSAMAIG